MPNDIPEVLQTLADACVGTIKEVSGPLSDGSGFAIMSMPLPKTHWLYQGDRTEPYGTFNTPPMPFRLGDKDVVSLLRQSPTSDKPFNMEPRIRMTRREFADRIQSAGKYAVRCATMNGREMDFDPDALLQNLVVGMLGYWSETGLSSDDWANPEGGGGANWKPDPPKETETSVLTQEMPQTTPFKPDFELPE